MLSAFHKTFSGTFSKNRSGTVCPAVLHGFRLFLKAHQTFLLLLLLWLSQPLRCFFSGLTGAADTVYGQARGLSRRAWRPGGKGKPRIFIPFVLYEEISFLAGLRKAPRRSSAGSVSPQRLFIGIFSGKQKFSSSAVIPAEKQEK
jgi:hypothetical protein